MSTSGYGKLSRNIQFAVHWTIQAELERPAREFLFVFDPGLARHAVDIAVGQRTRASESRRNLARLEILRKQADDL
jgi:hypothetical protein